MHGIKYMKINVAKNTGMCEDEETNFQETIAFDLYCSAINTLK